MRYRAFAHDWFVVGVAGLGIAAFLLFSPGFFATQAVDRKHGPPSKTESYADGLENYDIRTDKKAIDKLAGFRGAVGKNAADIANIRDEFVRGEGELRRRIPTLKVEYNSDLRVPEVIAPDVKQGKTTLSAQLSSSRSESLRAFAKQNATLIGITHSQADLLKIKADYNNPQDGLSFAQLEQTINDIPVFRGEIKAGFTKRGEIVRVVNNLAPGLDYTNLSSDFGDPVAAVRSAAENTNVDPSRLDLNRNAELSNNDKVTFGKSDSATTAERMYFPTEPGVAIPAWRVLIWKPQNAFYVIADAKTGTMLWRKNITEDQTQPATYSVYVNPNAMINVAHSPFPLSPGPTSPNGAQGIAIGRTPITMIGNEPPYTFNNLGWIPDGGTVTDGNAVQAGLDRDGTDGIDPNGEAFSPTRDFTFIYSPFDPNTNAGDIPVPVPQTYPGSAAQQGGITQLFYVCNWYHDEMYRLGFTEAAGNFQNNNFGRGGIAGDRVRAEGQDSLGTNNANFSTPADGGRGRMQMYIFTGPTPNIDGDFDADVIVHEHTHGLSNRLHGNSSGLSTTMSRGMGEGWSDFYGLAMLSQESDPINGIYTTGAYDTYLLANSNLGTNNYYYGIRRFPYAVKAFTGPNGRSHNPLTFADIDGSQMSLSDGAYAPRFTGTADEVHNAGEVWCSALWEMRARLVQRLGWTVGNRKALQIVTDGMKLAPLAPTFLQERDAIISAAQASSLSALEATADTADIWAGFAIRGMGASAQVRAVGSGVGDARVVEAFDLPNLTLGPNVTVTDGLGNHNGYPEPGESVFLSFNLTNNTGNDAVGTTFQVVGAGTANLGTIPNNAAAAVGMSYTIPSATACGTVLNLTINLNSSLGPANFTRSIIIGVPQTTFSENFDGVTTPAIPPGWTAAPVSGGTNFVTSTSNADTAPNAVFAVDPTSVGGGTDLTSPSIPISAAAATVSFRGRYDTEAGWDGGVLEISIGGGAFQDIITAGGGFVQNGYNSTLGVNTTGNSPLGGRAAWTGNSGGFITSVVRLPAAANGQNVQLRWRFGADDNTTGQGPNPGWYVDTVSVVGSYQCSTVSSARAPFDFDGDRKTDVSIFRPNGVNGAEWWYQRSIDGLVPANQFGSATDKVVAADYTGDGKTDIAFWRPSTGQWFVLRSEDGSYFAFPFGTNGDIAMPADFDGDGKADAAVFRPSTGTWYIQRSSDVGTTITQFGAAGDLPVAADYDGDGKADIGIFRPNGTSGGAEWWVQRSTAGLLALQFGSNTDKAVPGDYTGDGKADCAFYRASTGQWYVLRSEDFSYFAFPFGAVGDIPVPGDYDGDGKTDAAVFRPSNATWYVLRSTAGQLIFPFGNSTDTPVPNAFVR